jgi:hypothetical protein
MTFRIQNNSFYPQTISFSATPVTIGAGAYITRTDGDLANLDQAAVTQSLFISRLLVPLNADGSAFTGTPYPNWINPALTVSVNPPLLTYGYLDAQDQSASVAVSTAAATVLILPTIITQREFIKYDAATGVITFERSANYRHNLMLNVVATANRTIYAAAQLSTDGGTTWANSRRSARRSDVTSNTDGQVMFNSNNYFAANTKLRFILWASGACTIQSTDLPGVAAGTLTVPAARLLYTGEY